jgi:hypothetical protein
MLASSTKEDKKSYEEHKEEKATKNTGNKKK